MIGIPNNLIKGLEPVKAYLSSVKDIAKFDPNYLNPKHWKPNDFGFLTNTWITFYIETEDVNKLIKDQFSTTSFGSSTLSFITELIADVTGRFVSVTLNNISINLSKSPTIITKNVIGSSTTVKQFFSPNDWDINITGLLSGNSVYTQDSKAISLLWKIFETGLPVKVSNPELDIIYGVNQIVPYNYNFDQYNENYHLKQFTLSCKSDSEIKIIS